MSPLLDDTKSTRGFSIGGTHLGCFLKSGFQIAHSIQYRRQIYLAKVSQIAKRLS